jgi:hypothetical protein
MWIVHHLKNARFVDIKPPPFFTAKMRAEILAEPQAVNLRAKSEHFYMFGLQFSIL